MYDMTEKFHIGHLWAIFERFHVGHILVSSLDRELERATLHFFRVEMNLEES